jgi:hypothetical protein
LIILVLLAGWRYGFHSYPMFTTTFGNMLENFHTSLNSQSLFSKLITNQLLPEAIATHPSSFQKVLSAYIGLVLLGSAVLAYVNKQSEPLFIVLGIGSMLAPNWMWYHHYTFFIVPILTWIAWSRQNIYVRAWCLFGFLIIQIDRWYLTTGLLIHMFGHLSIIALLIGQIQNSSGLKLFTATNNEENAFEIS